MRVTTVSLVPRSDDKKITPGCRENGFIRHNPKNCSNSEHSYRNSSGAFPYKPHKLNVNLNCVKIACSKQSAY